MYYYKTRKKLINVTFSAMIKFDLLDLVKLKVKFILDLLMTY